MKIWWAVAFGVVCGLLGAGILFLVTAQPSGPAITLLPPPTEAPLLVHVTGAVTRPGVYALPPGSRVQDALQAAGGVLQEGQEAALNLAAPLQDGMKIFIATQETRPAAAGETPLAASSSNPSSVVESVPVTAVPSPGSIININTASLEELDTLPGIGPVMAQRILTYRQAHGLFANVEAIQDVSGIGPATFERIKPLIAVEAVP